MPQDPNLYGQRAPKKQKRDTALSSSLGFAAQLSSLISKPATPSASNVARTRGPKERRDEIFRSSKAKDRKSGENDSKLVLKEVHGTEDEAEERARARRRMEEKARRYAAMKRGDYVPGENEAAPLVDFDRKWAENAEDKQEVLTSSSEEDEDGGSGQIIEYEDEFGRLRKGTKADKERMERRARRGLLGAEELERMSARPSAPGNLIHGDAVQSMAFNPDDADKMEALARKRDRSVTPPDQTHYDADRDIRTKGVGFFKFSKDEAAREREMSNLAQERANTEAKRGEKEERREAMRREREQRSKELAEKRAKKKAEVFLEEMG